MPKRLTYEVGQKIGATFTITDMITDHLFELTCTCGNVIESSRKATSNRRTSIGCVKCANSSKEKRVSKRSVMTNYVQPDSRKKDLPVPQLGWDFIFGRLNPR